jgi:HEAT repeat protein
LIVAALSLAGLGASSQALAQDGAAPRSQVEALLGGIEYVPSAQQWQALGSEGEAALRQIAADTTAPRTRRGRALSALAHFPSPETRALVQSVLADPGAPILVKRKALRTATVAFGDQGLALVQPFLAHENKRLRESAILAVGKLKTPQARELLEARLTAEPAPYLKEVLRQALEVRP